MSDVQVTPIVYSVCAYPVEDINRSLFELRVEYRGEDRWAVVQRGRVLTRKGEWEYEPLPSSRTKAFLKRTRFSLDDALDRARRMAPDLTVNGHTIASALALTQPAAP